MAAKIKAAIPDAQVDLVRGKGGDFKVDFGAVRLWDKRNMDDEFPVEATIVEHLRTLGGHR